MIWVKQRYLSAVLAFSLASALQACATATAPVSARLGKEPAEVTVSSSTAVTASAENNRERKFHVVNKGDTLYSIAWHYNQDYQALASWNAVSPPFVIHPGEVIRLEPAKRKAAKESLQPGPILNKKNAGRKKTTAPPPAGTAQKPGGADYPADIRWQWPTRGKLLRADSPTAKKGIDISGRTGQKIVAAATGEVVYSGSGLLGYGKLIIIKHNNAYLSAYAHNQKMVVREGDKVKTGQQISTMGVDSRGTPVLHFEIRRNGKPVNPLRRLPRS